MLDYKYEWKDSYKGKGVVNKSLVGKIFTLLNEGTRYVDTKGKFIGYISVVNKGALLSAIHIISDHSLTTDKPYIFIKAYYLGRGVLCLVIDEDFLKVHTFENGHWTNAVMFDNTDRDEVYGT